MNIELLNEEKDFNENELVVFEKQNLALFKGLADATKAKKKLESDEKKLKTKLEKLMNEYGIKSIDNQFIKITRVNGSTSTSIDVKELEKKEPKFYAELLEDYPKITTRKDSIRFEVK